MHRKNQNINWFLQTVDDHIKDFFHQKPAFQKSRDQMLTQVVENKVSPFYAAKVVLDKVSKEL